MSAQARKARIARQAIDQINAYLDGKVDKITLPPVARPVSARSTPVQYALTQTALSTPLERVQSRIGGRIRRSRNGADYILLREHGLIVLYRESSRAFSIFEGFNTPRFKKAAPDVLGENEVVDIVEALLPPVA